MKISLDEKEMENYKKAKLEYITNGRRSFGIYGEANLDTEKSVNFKIVDIDKANNFFMQVLYDENFKEKFTDTTGISITQANHFKSVSKEVIDNIKEYLKIILDSVG